MKRALKSDDYFETPPDLFEELDREFRFDLDAAGDFVNAKCNEYLDEETNALLQRWSCLGKVIFCNPPYSKEGQKDAFIAKAAEAQADGCTVVMVIPAKVNTKAFHKYIWDRERHAPRPGVEVRFLEGRPRFWLNGKPTGGGRNEIMIVVFRPVNAQRDVLSSVG